MRCASCDVELFEHERAELPSDPELCDCCYKAELSQRDFEADVYANDLGPDDGYPDDNLGPTPEHDRRGHFDEGP